MQEAERKKAIEKDKLEAENIAKMQALEAQGKKVAGGMHKFDASQVDARRQRDRRRLPRCVWLRAGRGSGRHGRRMTERWAQGGEGSGCSVYRWRSVAARAPAIEENAVRSRPLKAGVRRRQSTGFSVTIVRVRGARRHRRSRDRAVEGGSDGAEAPSGMAWHLSSYIFLPALEPDHV